MPRQAQAHVAVVSRGAGGAEAVLAWFSHQAWVAAVSAGCRKRPSVAPMGPGTGAVVPGTKLRPPEVEVRVVEDGRHVGEETRRFGVADRSPFALVDRPALVAARRKSLCGRSLPDGRRVA